MLINGPWTYNNIHCISANHLNLFYSWLIKSKIIAIISQSPYLSMVSIITNTYYGYLRPLDEIYQFLPMISLHCYHKPYSHTCMPPLSPLPDIPSTSSIMRAWRLPLLAPPPPMVYHITCMHTTSKHTN